MTLSNIKIISNKLVLSHNLPKTDSIFSSIDNRCRVCSVLDIEDFPFHLLPRGFLDCLRFFVRICTCNHTPMPQNNLYYLSAQVACPHPDNHKRYFVFSNLLYSFYLTLIFVNIQEAVVSTTEWNAVFPNYVSNSTFECIILLTNLFFFKFEELFTDLNLP